MRILMIGAGGVGTAAAKIAARRQFFETYVVTDYDEARAQRVVDELADPRFVAARVDASDADDVARIAREHAVTHVFNAVDPRFVMPIFDGAFAAGADYLDMAMSLSYPHPDRPYEETGVKLGDDQFAQSAEWEAAGRLALVGIGVEPGLSDVFARYAADELFSVIDELGVRDGANLTVAGYDFAPSFSIWTTIEECLNPPVVYEKDRGWFTTAPFSEPETFDVPRRHRSGRVRQRRARGGAPDAAMGRRQAGDVQVRAGRRVHRRAAGAAQDRARLDRPRSRSAGSRSRPATSSRPASLTRPGSATR